MTKDPTTIDFSELVARKIADDHANGIPYRFNKDTPLEYDHSVVNESFVCTHCNRRNIFARTNRISICKFCSKPFTPG